MVLDKHNPDTNPNWVPNIARRVYACNRCDTETIIETNHTGTVWETRCVGRCRNIINPNTSHETVLPYYGPHRFLRACGVES